jgi:hypothetical protein
MILLAQAAPVLCGALQVLAHGQALAGVDHNINILLPVTKIWLPRRQQLRVCDGATLIGRMSGAVTTSGYSPAGCRAARGRFDHNTNLAPVTTCGTSQA